MVSTFCTKKQRATSIQPNFMTKSKQIDREKHILHSLLRAKYIHSILTFWGDLLIPASLNIIQFNQTVTFFSSISAYIAHHNLENVKPPVHVDITMPVEQWKNGNFTSNSCDIIYNANMVHISPWATAVVSAFLIIKHNVCGSANYFF